VISINLDVIRPNFRVSCERSSNSGPAVSGLSAQPMMPGKLILCEHEKIDEDSDYLSKIRILDQSQLRKHLDFELEMHGFCVVDVGNQATRVLSAALSSVVSFFDASDNIKLATRNIICESGSVHNVRGSL
jgi:hypothetical protein